MEPTTIPITVHNDKPFDGPGEGEGEGEGEGVGEGGGEGGFGINAPDALPLIVAPPAWNLGAIEGGPIFDPSKNQSSKLKILPIATPAVEDFDGSVK